MLLHTKLLGLLSFSFIKSVSEDCVKGEHTCKRSTRVLAHTGSINAFTFLYPLLSLLTRIAYSWSSARFAKTLRYSKAVSYLLR